jgi:hypothetical protein
MLVARTPQPHAPDVPDLQTQLESLLDSVWKAEADWRFDDRIDLALQLRRPARDPHSG